MNIKQFIEDSEREFNQSFGNNSHASQQEIYDATKFFSLKLHELIGKVRKEIRIVVNDIAHKQAGKYAGEQIWHQPYASNRIIQTGWEIERVVLQLLDETK